MGKLKNVIISEISAAIFVLVVFAAVKETGQMEIPARFIAIIALISFMFAAVEAGFALAFGVLTLVALHPVYFRGFSVSDVALASLLATFAAFSAIIAAEESVVYTASVFTGIIAFFAFALALGDIISETTAYVVLTIFFAVVAVVAADTFAQENRSVRKQPVLVSLLVEALTVGLAIGLRSWIPAVAGCAILLVMLVIAWAGLLPWEVDYRMKKNKR